MKSERRRIKTKQKSNKQDEIVLAAVIEEKNRQRPCHSSMMSMHSYFRYHLHTTKIICIFEAHFTRTKYNNDDDDEYDFFAADLFRFTIYSAYDSSHGIRQIMETNKKCNYKCCCWIVLISFCVSRKIEWVITLFILLLFTKSNNRNNNKCFFYKMLH